MATPKNSCGHVKLESRLVEESLMPGIPRRASESPRLAQTGSQTPFETNAEDPALRKMLRRHPATGGSSQKVRRALRIQP
jgi:hypothetical protein